jgi:hypothetical protein
MVHVPTVTIVTLVPETVQMAVVVEAKLTGRPDDAVALTVNAVGLYARLASVANVMVWLAFDIVKLRLTGVAAA